VRLPCPATRVASRACLVSALCPSLRFGIPFDAFRAAVEANPFLLAANDVTIRSYESVGGLAVVQGGWIDSTNGTVRTTVWYAEDVGSVRSESETTLGEHTTKVVVELVDRGNDG